MAKPDFTSLKDSPYPFTTSHVAKDLFYKLYTAKEMAAFSVIKRILPSVPGKPSGCAEPKDPKIRCFLYNSLQSDT